MNIYTVVLPCGGTWKVRAENNYEAIRKAEKRDGIHIGTVQKKPPAARVSRVSGPK